MFYLTTHSTHFIYGYMVIKDHSDSEKGNPLLPHRLLFPISSKGSFICIFVTPVVEHWLEREIEALPGPDTAYTYPNSDSFCSIPLPALRALSKAPA